MANFKKIIAFHILFFIFYNVYSYSEVVNKVDVQGNDRISSETIMIFGDIVIGNNYEESDVSLLIKKLYETRFFSNISVELANNKLTIVVEENPIVYSIIFKGEKAKKHVEQIKEFLLVREKSSYVSNNIKHDINQIKSFYRARGYYFVKIDAEIEKLEKNRVNIFYSIDAGEKAKISKIYFLGDKKFRDKRLRDIITEKIFQTPYCPIVSNYDAKDRTNTDEIKHALIEQIDNTVLWLASVKQLGNINNNFVLHIVIKFPFIQDNIKFNQITYTGFFV